MISEQTTLEILEFSSEPQKSSFSLLSTTAITTLTSTQSHFQAIQEEENEDQLLDLLELIKAPLKNKSKTPHNPPTIKKVSSEDVKMGLVTQIDIRCDERLKIIDLWKSMTVYYFQKPSKSLFGESGETVQKNLYYTSVALMDIYSKFLMQRDHKAMFYLLSKNQTILFNSYEEQKFVLIHTKQREMLCCIERVGISQHTMMLEQTNDYATLIRSRNVRLFWNWYMNELLTNSAPFQIIANFRFNCCQERFPMQVYNGKQKHTKDKEYLMKVQGYFFRQNIEKLNSQVEDKLNINFKTYSITTKFENIISKAFLYESDEQDSQSEESERMSIEYSQQ